MVWGGRILAKAFLVGTGDLSAGSLGHLHQFYVGIGFSPTLHRTHPTLFGFYKPALACLDDLGVFTHDYNLHQHGDLSQYDLVVGMELDQ